MHASMACASESSAACLAFAPHSLVCCCVFRRVNRHASARLGRSGWWQEPAPPRPPPQQPAAWPRRCCRVAGSHAVAQALHARPEHGPPRFRASGPHGCRGELGGAQLCPRFGVCGRAAAHARGDLDLCFAAAHLRRVACLLPLSAAQQVRPSPELGVDPVPRILGGDDLGATVGAGRQRQWQRQQLQQRWPPSESNRPWSKRSRQCRRG